MKLRQRVVVGAAAGVAVVMVAGEASAAAPGPAAGAPAWRSVLDAPSLRYLSRVAVVDGDSAWAFGGLSVSDDTVDPTAFRWERGRWQRVAFPARRGGPVNGVAVASARDVWAGTGGSLSSPALVMRWNGSKWNVAKRLPKSAFVSEVTAAGPRDVWTFTSTGPGRSSTAWHYTARGWAKVTLPFNVLRASARSPRDIWAIALAGGDDPLSLRTTLVHYDGKAWRTVPLPKMPRPRERHGLMGITANAQGVWITDSVDGVSKPIVDSVLLHRDPQGRWRTEQLYPKVGRWAQDVAPVPDGRGGLWFLGSTDINGYDSALVHRSAAGRWTRSRITPVAELRSLARLPGSNRLLATGNRSGRGVVLSYQPPK